MTEPKPRLNILITSYHYSHLYISLNSVKNMSNNYNCRVIIYNDNPDVTISDYNINTICGKQIRDLVIINSDQNVGCFYARYNMIKYIEENQLAADYLIWLDSDDQLLDIDLSSNKDVINHNGVVVKGFTELFDILLSKEISFTSKIGDEKPKSGCVGPAYKQQLWIDMLKVYEDWLPTLHQMYGSKRIFEPDDMIYMFMIKWYLAYMIQQIEFPSLSLSEIISNILINRDHPNCPYYDSDKYSYALTLLDDRKDRYDTDPNCSDLRYGTVYGSKYTNYQQFYNDLDMSLKNYLERPINTAV